MRAGSASYTSFSGPVSVGPLVWAASIPFPHTRMRGSRHLIRRSSSMLLSLRDRLRQSRYRGSRRSCGLVCFGRAHPLSGPLVGVPAAIAVDCAHTLDVTCAIGVVCLLLTAQSCTDESELVLQTGFILMPNSSGSMMGCVRSFFHTR